MASNRFWNRVLGKRYAPSRQSKPLFMERRLDNLFGSDKDGKFGISEPLFRTLNINAHTERPSRNHLDTYDIQYNDQLFAFAGPGFDQFSIQPGVGEVWLMDRITVWQDDNQARDFNLIITNFGGPGAENLPIPIYPTGHVVIENGGAQAEQTLFPVYHALGGVEQDHFATVSGPLQIDNGHFIDIQAVNLTVDALYNYKWLYRRIK